MSEWLILLIPVLVAPVVLLLAFAGCEPFGATPSETPKPPDQVSRPPYDQVILGTPGLVSYWRLGEKSGAVAEDIGPAKRNGTYKGSVTLGQTVGALAARDPLDKAAEFGAGNDHVEVQWTGLHNPPSFSLEAWIRPGASSDQAIVISSWRLDQNVTQGFDVGVPRTGAPRIRGRIGTGSGGTREVEWPVTGPALGAVWRHVVLTYDGSSKALQLFVDGNAAALESGLDYAANDDASQPLRIGAGRQLNQPAQTGPANFFLGPIDEVALYNTALSATQVQDHFKASLAS
jgi:hypothetical protein